MNRNFIMEQVIKVKQISAAQIVKLVGLIIFLGVMPEDLFTKIFSISPFYFIPFYIIARIAFHKLKNKSLYLAVIWTFPLFFIAQIELQYKMFNARSEQLEKLYYKPQILSSEFFYKLTEDKLRQNSFDTKDILNFLKRRRWVNLFPELNFMMGR